MAEPEERGGVVTVTDRLGKYDPGCDGSTGEAFDDDSSGDVTGVVKLCWEMYESESSRDCIDDDEE